MDLKELSPGPQKWSPNISKATNVFRFCKSGPEVDVKKPIDDVTSVASTSVQRKRKDPRTNPEHTDSKKISRSSRFDISVFISSLVSSLPFSCFRWSCSYFWRQLNNLGKIFSDSRLSSQINKSKVFRYFWELADFVYLSSIILSFSIVNFGIPSWFLLIWFFWILL